MNENPNIFRNSGVIEVEKTLLAKLADIEKRHPKYFKEKPGTLKNYVILTYPSKDNDYQYAFALRPNSGLSAAVQKKCLAAFAELEAELASQQIDPAYPPAGLIN